MASDLIPTIVPNKHVTLGYTLRNVKGEVIDGSDLEGGEPIQYVHGYGMLVPGLESRVAGLLKGEKKEIVVPPEEAFGVRDDELVLEIDRSELPNPKEVEEGDELVAESEDGDEAVLRVVQVNGDAVMVDGNHPLAGETLHYDIEVLDIREATPSEIEDAAELMEATRPHDEDEEGHEHHHHDAEPGLVTLRKKPVNKMLN